MCLYPKLIDNPKYKKNKKNRGVIPPIRDSRVLLVPIGCGKCMECRKQEKTKWQVRLLEDIRHNKNGIFVTLTFSDESIKKLSEEIKGLSGYELDNEICTIAVHRFRERWRKKYKKSIRHWLITEIGHKGTENVHMHGIVWTDESAEEVERIWKYGGIWKGNKKSDGTYENYVNEKTVNYSTKYVHKIDKDHLYYKPKVLTSSGIGNGYIGRGDARRNKYKENGETNEAYKTRTGHDIALPVYWRNKIYTEEEREKLWIEKLDKEIRYVGGEKVSIKEGEEEYYKLLEWHREKNDRLGYGNDKINWERKRYENKRRYLKQKERVMNANGSRRSSRFVNSAPTERPIEPNEPTALFRGIKPNENINWEEM